MKPIIINFTDDEGKTTKTYSTVSIKTGIVDSIFEMAEEADKFDKEDLSIPEVRKFYRDLKSLILAIFGYRFSLEEMNDNVDINELMRVYNDVCNKIGGGFQKN